jgi:predicted CoA-substrate-specific enzyme activase
MTLVVGVDIGSTTAKAVALDGDSNVIASHLVYEGIVNREAAEQCLEELLAIAGVTRGAVDYVVTTGYGRELVSYGDLSVTEISCHADGVHFLFPEVRTVIDIGGQDSKAIGLDDNGNVMNFRMNDRCAAGTGRFLEVMANTLRIPLDEIGELALQSTKPADVSATCTVFAESEIVSLSAQGHPPVDIVAGLHESIGRRVSAMARTVGLRPPIAMTGGVAKNVGAVAVLGRLLGSPLLVPPDPQIIGALGAARCALRQVAGGPAPARALHVVPAPAPAAAPSLAACEGCSLSA